MAALLEGESLEYKSLRRGDILEGVVVGSDRDGMVVDVGTKSEGVVPPSEMHSLGPNVETWPGPGDRVLVYVMQPETPEGQVLLSLDRARGEKGWRILQQRFDEGESFEVTVGGYNKGGLLVNVEGVHGFIPFSQSVSAQSPAEGEEKESEAPPEAVVGRTLLVKVIEINRARNRVILSERAALQDWRALQKDRLLDELQEGEIRKGRISSIRSFGVFVDMGGADGLAHLSELSWERDKTPEELYHVGQEVDVYVMKVDQEAKKIALSIRRAQPERWEEIVDKYTVGQIVTGTITKLVTFGAFARIEGPVEGLIHVSELVNRRIAHPREVVKEGDVAPLKIVRIERDRQRLGLSLRQAHDEAEDLGFVFDKDGRVVGLPGGVPQKGAKAEGEEDEEAEAPEAAIEEVAAAEEEAIVEEAAELETAAAEEEAIVEEAAELETAAAGEIEASEAEEAPSEEPAAEEKTEAVEEEAAETEAIETAAADEIAVSEEEAPAEKTEAVEEEAAETEAIETATADEIAVSEEEEAPAEKTEAVEEEAAETEAIETATADVPEAVEEEAVEDVAAAEAEAEAEETAVEEAVEMEAVEAVEAEAITEIEAEEAVETKAAEAVEAVPIADLEAETVAEMEPEEASETVTATVAEAADEPAVEEVAAEEAEGKDDTGPAEGSDEEPPADAGEEGSVKEDA
jgi:small subunit ribosomal protein S1